MSKINFISPHNKRVISIFKKNKGFFLILGVYLIFGMILISCNNFVLFNNDGVSYITIAQKYYYGNFTDAINGYWGPLFSWMLVPLLYMFGASPSQSLFAAKILSLIIGLFTIIGFRILLYRFEIDEKIANIMTLALIPEVIYFVLAWVTPDLLITCMLIFYLIFLFSPEYTNKISVGLLCGIFGGLAYLSKSYGLIFFITSFILINLLYLFKMKSKRRDILKIAFIGLGIFLVISGTWTVLISNKYGYFSISTSAKYNIDLINTGSLEIPTTDPSAFQGLNKPPNKSAVSAWEDPSYLKVKTINTKSSDLLEHEIKNILKNIFIFLNIIERFSILSLFIIIISVLCYFKTSNKKLKQNIIYLLLIILLYSGGYIIIFMEERYLILDYILILLLGCVLLGVLFKGYPLKKMTKNLITIIFIITFIMTPLTNIYLNLNDETDLNITGLYNLIPSLENYGIEGKNIASNKNSVYTEFIAYFLKAHYYGSTDKLRNTSELQEELKNNNIDFYFVWVFSIHDDVYLPYTEITGGKIEYLKIYKLT